MENKTIFNLYLTFEDALKAAQVFQSEHKDLHIWEDPRNLYGERMKFRTDGLYKESTFVSDIEDMDLALGFVDKEAKAVLFWMIGKYNGFNDLELGQVIVGEQRMGIEGDTEVAIFTYLSREDDFLRDFISEKAYELTRK